MRQRLAREVLCKKYRHNGYDIFGIAPLDSRNIIPSCNDLDILCCPGVWEIVSRMGRKKVLPEYDVTVATIFDGAINFGRTWGIGNFDVDASIDTAEITGGLPLVRIEHVIRYKRIRSSAKDLLHLDALRASDHLL
jgi:hypothetical protein